MRKNTFYCIDIGSKQSGIAIIENMAIKTTYMIENVKLFDDMMGFDKAVTIFLIEDIAPYSLRITKDIIDTCKYIGELEYRLNERQMDYKLILRWEVKKWVFDIYYDIVIDEIERRIVTNNLIKKDGEYRQASFVFVNDRNVLNSMRIRWDIPRPRVGQKNPYGLASHTWQALALGSYYIDLTKE